MCACANAWSGFSRRSAIRARRCRCSSPAAFARSLEAWRRAGKRAAIWGAGSKGVTFLNVLGAGDDVIPVAVDLNPAKHGRFVAGTGQHIVAPAELQDVLPDVVVVMNPLYRAEIGDALAALGLQPELAVA